MNADGMQHVFDAIRADLAEIERMVDRLPTKRTLVIILIVVNLAVGGALGIAKLMHP
jgi:hypothetical protein